MAQNPTTQEATLRALALRLRLSAVETEDGDYIALFLAAALALEARADRETGFSSHFLN